MRPWRPSPANRRLYACVLALFALGWLLDRAHLAFEPHHFCVEHGRVEHAGGLATPGAQAGSAQHGAASDRAASDGAASDGPVLEGRSESDHATCCVPLARSEEPLALVHPPLDAFAWVPSPAVAADCAERAGTRSSVPLVLLAPKQSPPRG